MSFLSHNLLRAARYFRPYAGRICVILTPLLLSVSLNVLKPWPFALLVDNVLGNKPTSALDVESEAQVAASFFELMRGRTTLMVAHRLSTIRKVNKILVIEDGQVSEFGSPDELLARQGYYARVIANQTELPASQ